MVVDFEKKKKILYFEWCLVVVDRLSARKKKKKMIAKFSRSYFLVGSCNCKCQMVPRDGEGPCIHQLWGGSYTKTDLKFRRAIQALSTYVGTAHKLKGYKCGLN